MTLFLNYCIFSGGAEALVRCGGKLDHLLIAFFLGNMCAKYYENPTMLSRVIAKNVGDVFFETHCMWFCAWNTRSFSSWNYLRFDDVRLAQVSDAE